MKKITNLLRLFSVITVVKNFFRRLALVVIGIAISSSLQAIQYCQHTLTNGANSVLVSMESPSAGTYVIKIESAVVMTGIHAGWWVGLSSGNVQAMNYAVLSNGGKTYTVTLPSTTAPNLYTQLHILYPGLVMYAWPPSITWGACVVAGVPTLAATSVTSTSAVSGGEVTADGESSVTARGVCWSTSTSPSVDLPTKTSDGTGLGAFSSSITGLTPGTTYYVRSYATNSSGTAYGAQISFTTLDTEAPTAFTATKGTVGVTTVELLLNATDNSGSVNYTISYGSGPTIINTTGVSGVEKSYLVTGLAESTAYAFSIVAKDAAANEATNSPIVVNATTLENTNTACEGTSTESSQGSFVLGYNYKFTTTGTDVIVEFELLDNKDGVVAYAWTYNPNFAETAMTLVSGKKFTKTFTGQTIDATFKVACKFAFAGGMAVTKTYEYTVGDNCTTTEIKTPNLQKVKLFPNPVQNELQINTEQTISFIAIHNVLGQTVKTISVRGNEETIDLSTLSSGNYFVTIALENGNLIKQKILKL